MTNKKKRIIHSPEFKAETLKLAEKVRQRIFEYIEVDYNRTRGHSVLGYLSPVNFETQNVA